MTRRRWASMGLLAIASAAMWAGCAAGVSAIGGGGEGGEGGEYNPTTTSSGAGGSKDGGPMWDGAAIPCNEAKDCALLTGPCVQGTCTNGVCSPEPANEFGACDDGIFCTENDTCVSGKCEGGTQKFCSSLDSCHLGVCDEELKTCKNIVGNDGAQCDDMDLCTMSGICSAGVCAKGQPVDCSIFNGQCTTGACDPAVGCYAAPAFEGKPCDDGQFCMVSETCQAGKCLSTTPNPCAPPGGCFIAACDEANDECSASPGNDGQACDDFSPCTVNTTCLAGACINGDASNDGMACDDGTSCTTGEFCSGGTCGGGIGPEVYFGDTFADASKGWTLGPEWQIGPAKASSNGVFGADPEEDHTPTLDDGIAGVVIGGNAGINLHSYYWLESPTFNTSSAAGQVIFGFYRLLNSDYDPFMHNAVEVWNGTQWINLWTSGGPPGVQDPGWTYIQYDVTPYKNAGMRVRFGFDVTSGGVFTIGSWNIDDVLIASQACP